MEEIWWVCYFVAYQYISLEETMACTGSINPPTYGTPGEYYTCPAGAVLVGADLAYTSPLQASCSASAGTCSAGGAGATWQPGTVRGITAYYCASAAAAAGEPPRAMTRTPLAPATDVAGATIATFTCPAGQAFTGATAWIDGHQDTEQIQFNCSKFAPDAAPGMLSSLYPSNLALGSSARPVKLSTLAGAPTALFNTAIAQAHNSAGVLNSLGFGCQDYADELDTSAARQRACCAGTATNPQFCRGFTPQSVTCDTYMAKYCAGNCTAGNCLDPVCGCLGSPVALPGCYDNRCADTPGAYRTALIGGQQVCPAASCDIWQELGKGQYLAKETPAPSNCALPLSLFSDTTIIVVLAFIILIMIAGRLFNNREPPPALPIPPPDLF